MITIHDDRTVTFRVFRSGARRVDLMADCTNWAHGKIPLTPDHDADRPGWWHVTLAMPAGEHRFGYLIDGHEWQPDYAAHGIELSYLNSFHSIIRIHDRSPKPANPAIAPAPAAAAGSTDVVTRPTPAAWQQDVHAKLAA